MFIRIRINAKPLKLSLINAYVPTEVAEDKEKGAFYDELEKVCEHIVMQETLILLTILTQILSKMFYRGSGKQLKKHIIE